MYILGKKKKSRVLREKEENPIPIAAKRRQTNKQTIMIYLKNMAIQRIVSIYKDLWSGIQGLVSAL